MAVEVRPFRDPNNVDILNAIRKNASLDYQKRIPAATKANIQDTLHNLLNYRPAMNEFIDALVNRIGLEIVRNIMWSNPMAKFKRGMLEYGDTIEEINVGLLKAKNYETERDYLEKDIFGQERPDVQTSFHKTNRQDYYKLSINEAILKRAFLNSNGLSNFITNLMTTATTSDNWDEFLLTVSLFDEYEKAGGFFDVNVPDVSAQGSTEADAKFMLRRVREFAENLKFPSTHYNASGMPAFANPDELELFITPEANAALDVEALAGAFNIEKANMPSRTTVIPREHFGNSDTQAILTTRDFFVIADQRIDTTSAVNPVGLITNYFLHHWQVISASRFVPAVRFTISEGDVIEITPTPVTSVSAITFADADENTVTELERGELYEVIAEAVTTPEGGDNNAVRFELIGNESPKTYVDNGRYLFVSIEEPAETITVNAYAVDNDGDEELMSTVDVTITGDQAQLWPDPQVVEPVADPEG